MIRRLCLIYTLFLGLFVFVPAHLAAALPVDGRGTILIISSYNPDTRRMSSFISDFEQRIVSSDVPCDIYVENLECRGVDDAPIWMEQTKNVIRRYESTGLRAIILLGQEAWASFVSLGNFPRNVQIYGCYASTHGVMLPPPEALGDESEWMPESVDFMAKMDTLRFAGGLLNHYDIGRNIKLITSLYPQVENIAFISDNTYGGISLQALMRKEMANYPGLRLILLDSRIGEQEIKEAYSNLPTKSAVLVGTWRVGRQGQYLMQRSLNELVKCKPTLPVFSIAGTGIGDVAIGGYVPDYDNGAKVIADQIIWAYRHGDLDNAHFHATKGTYLFDARKLKEFKIPEYALPKGSVVEDTIAAKLSKYSHYISLLSAALALLGVLIAFLVWLFVRTRRLTLALEKREGELVVARERAEESDRLKSAFLANMSHEIRTPLNAIVGFSSLMGSEELSHEERAEYCSIVINNSEMLLTLLNDILDISSLECGKTRFNYAQEDVVEICRHVMLTTAHTRKPGVEGVFVPPCDSLMLVTDAHRLSQILINLLTNAGKFTEEGSITLAFEVRQEERMVYFSVTDTGRGIPAGMHEAVFNRFEKLKGNMKKGTGLGLAICRQTASIFGGRIWVDEHYTAGARFVFTHPLDIVLPTPEDEDHSEGKEFSGARGSNSPQI